MLADCLQEDRRLALVLLKPGWEADYHNKPAIHAVACLGRVFNEELLPDGRYNLLLQGQSRVRILEELPSAKLYRSARIEVLPDQPLGTGDVERQLRQRLERAVCLRFAGQGLAVKEVHKLMSSARPLGELCDIFAFALPLGADFKQELLEQPGSEQRVRRMLELLEPAPLAGEGSATNRKWPPDFSFN
jgi:Lon protease-like protein